MCRVFSYVVGRGCLLWPVHFLGKTLLVFALLHSAFQGPRDHLSAITNKIQTSCWVRPLFLFPLFTQQTFTEGLSCVKNWARIMTINRNICCSCLVSKSCLPLYNPTAWGPPGSSVHGISQARMLEWVSLSFSRGSSWPKDWTRVSCTAGRFFTIRATAAAAKSLQSCLTLYNPIDGSPLGSPVSGILQARTLEWVAISFSNAWKWKVKVKSLSCVQLCATSWTAAYQAPPSMGFSRQNYWSGVPLPSPLGKPQKKVWGLIFKNHTKKQKQLDLHFSDDSWYCASFDAFVGDWYVFEEIYIYPFF